MRKTAPKALRVSAKPAAKRKASTVVDKPKAAKPRVGVRWLLAEFLDTIGVADPERAKEVEHWRAVLHGLPRLHVQPARREFLVRLNKSHAYALREFVKLFNVEAETALAALAGEQIACLETDPEFLLDQGRIAVAFKEQRLATLRENVKARVAVKEGRAA